MRALRTSVVAVAVAVILAATARRARAAGEDATFAWDAPEGCPTSTDVEARIARRLDPSHRRPRVRASVTRDEDGFHVLLGDGRAERTITAPTCEAAAEAVAVVVALAAVQEEVVPLTDAPRPVADNPSSAAPVWRADLHVAGRLDSASLPAPSPGLAVGAEARRGALAGGLTLGGFLRQTSRTGDRPIEANIVLFDAMITGCALAPVASSLEVGGCLGGGIGIFLGSSAGVANPASGVGFRPQGEALARAGITLTDRLSLRFDGGILVDPLRSPFRIANVGDVHQPAGASFRASAGLEVRIR